MHHESPGEIAVIESWFVARGLPHFVERRPNAWQIWGRSIPLLLAAYPLLGLNALDLAEWSVSGNVLAAALVIAVLVLTWIGANVLRRRPPLQRPGTVGPAELALVVIAPAIPSAMFGQWGDVAQTLLEGAVVLGAVWALTSYGVVPLLRWAGGRTWSQLTVFLNLIVRGLPLLLLFMTFLFINAEVWEVAGTLHGPAYVAVLVIFFVLGTVFLLSRLPALLDQQNSFDGWDEVAELVRAADVVPDEFVERTIAAAAWTGADRPVIRQRFNLGLLSMFSQGMPIAATSLAMFGFFTAFGVLAISAETTTAWTASNGVHVLAETHLGGHRLVLTEPLLRVSGFLAAFTGMYFTVVQATDATYRDEFSEDIGPELHEALAMRVLYRQALASS